MSLIPASSSGNERGVAVVVVVPADNDEDDDAVVVVVGDVREAARRALSSTKHWRHRDDADDSPESSSRLRESSRFHSSLWREKMEGRGEGGRMDGG